MADSDLFALLHTETRRTLTIFVDVTIETMDTCGVGVDPDPKVFERTMRGLLVKIAKEPEATSGASALKISGAEDKRKSLIVDVLLSFGADETSAEKVARMVFAVDVNSVASGPMDGNLNWTLKRDPRLTEITRRIALIYREAREMYDRILELKREVGAPYQGEYTGPRAGPMAIPQSVVDSRGVNQVCTLLSQFPTVADIIYEKAGLLGLTSFPPQPTSGYLDVRAQEFKTIADGWAEDKKFLGWIKIAGFMIAGVALSLISGASLSPFVAGVGIGLSAGVPEVVAKSSALRHERDAWAMGAGTKSRVETAQGDVQGAWGALVVNALSGGALAKIGGAPGLSQLSRFVRVTTISGAGGGVTAAANPNVWKSENTGGIILMGTLIGAGVGAGGTAAAAGAVRWLGAPGSVVQIGVTRVEGELAKGKTVSVQLKPDAPLVQAKVVSVSERDNTVLLDVDGTQGLVKVGRVAQLESDIFNDSMLVRALRPATTDDFYLEGGFRRSQSLILLRDGEMIRGEALLTPDGRVNFGGQRLTNINDAEVSDFSVLDYRKYSQLVGISEKELRQLEVAAGRRDPSSSSSGGPMMVQPVPGSPGFYVSQPARPAQGRRVSILPGPTRDQGRAFRRGEDLDLPSEIDMRGRGPGPTIDEVALFGAHGSAWGFSGISTRKAARTVADAVVTLNRNSGHRPIRAVQLVACAQGNRRFLFVGRTNAESFQAHLNMRLRELGVDPGRDQGITVLAADRSGLLVVAGKTSDQVVRRGGSEHTPFVPAGTQRPLSYRQDYDPLTLAWGAASIVADTKELQGILLIGGVLIGVAQFGDVNAMMDWLGDHKDKVVGWIFDAKVRVGSGL